MSRLILARTRYQYDSYVDFWELVRLSGLDTCYVDEIDLTTEATYVVTPVNGELRPHIIHQRGRGLPKKATVVWWNLERPDGKDLHAEITDMMQYVDRIWVSDRHFSSLDPRLMHVVLGSHPGLRRGHGSVHARYQICHMSYVNARRSPVIGSVSRSCSVAPNAWGEKRDMILRASDIMLNIHQTPAQTGEPLRFALTAAYGLPLVTELLADPWPLVRERDFISSDLGSLPFLIHELVRNKILRGQLGASLQKLLTEEWTFSRGIRDGLDRSQ